MKALKLLFQQSTLILSDMTGFEKWKKKRMSQHKSKVLGEPEKHPIQKNESQANDKQQWVMRGKTLDPEARTHSQELETNPFRPCMNVSVSRSSDLGEAEERGLFQTIHESSIPVPIKLGENTGNQRDADLDIPPVIQSNQRTEEIKIPLGNF